MTARRKELPSADTLVALKRSIRSHGILASVGLFLLFGVAIAWAGATEFAGAVIASGQFAVDSSVKKVQHPTGGIVEALRVRDGDRVKAGDELLRLDQTLTRVNLAII